MDAKMLREIELWCGLAAAVMGIIGPVYGLIFAQDISTELGSIFLVLLGLDLGVAVGAMVDSQSRSSQAASTALALLWSATVPLVALVFLHVYGIGLYILPAAILALAAALAGSLADLVTRRVPR